MTTTETAARQILDTWDQLTDDDFAALNSDDGMEIDGCAVWVRSTDNKIVAFRQDDGGPEEWAEIDAPATGRRLIANNGEHTDLGPATVAHIAAQVAAERRDETSFAADADTLSVVRPGEPGYDAAITVWVD